MKHRLCPILLAVLLLMMSALPALASVRATGDVNIRTGPGLGYDVVTSVSTGAVMDDLGDTATDERGVDWYRISYGTETGWVSSTYAERTGGTVSAPAQSAGQYVELSGYYGTNLDQAAAQLSLTDFRSVASEAPRRYYNQSVAVSGNENVEHFMVTGVGYALFGVTVGMDMDETIDKLRAAGLVDTGDNGWNMYVFEHPSKDDPEVFDSCINVSYANGVVTELDWSTYTG